MIEELLLAIKDQIMRHMQYELVRPITPHIVQAAFKAGLNAMNPDIIIETDVDQGSFTVHLEYPDEAAIRRAVDEFFS